MSAGEGEIDRIAPTLRPRGIPVMRQRWADLLFLHWEMPPETLRRLLPPGLVLDTFEGRAYVGLVPFTMTGVRPICLPALPGLSHFHETNVRTYVIGPERVPGVWFFSLDAANPLAVVGARVFWKLPYHFADMTMACENGVIGYASERRWPGPLPAACALRYGPAGPAAPAAPGTLEHFLVERYVLFACAHRRLFRCRIHHWPYPLQAATVDGLKETLVAAAGIDRPDAAPLAHYAREVDVRIFPLRRVT